MYEVDGDFGKVRQVRIPNNICKPDVPFRLLNAGWHLCNDKYTYHRETGFPEGHLFLFSVNDGGRIIFRDQDPIALPAGSVTWIPPMQKHTYYTEKNSLWELYWLHIGDSAMLRPEDIFCGIPFIQLSHMDNISREFEVMLHNKDLLSSELPFEISQRISTIYHIMLRESYSRNHSLKKGDELIHRIIRDMDEACDKDWNLSELSVQYFISVPQLIRRFKAETGMTPYAYLLLLRLQKAEMYLKYTGLSVCEISLKTGFPNPSNFIQQFRSRYGITPQKYRG